MTSTSTPPPPSSSLPLSFCIFWFACQFINVSLALEVDRPIVLPSSRTPHRVVSSYPSVTQLTPPFLLPIVFCRFHLERYRWTGTAPAWLDGISSGCLRYYFHCLSGRLSYLWCVLIYLSPLLQHAQNIFHRILIRLSPFLRITAMAIVPNRAMLIPSQIINICSLNEGKWRTFVSGGVGGVGRASEKNVWTSRFLPLVWPFGGNIVYRHICASLIH